jgi:hypothetical protein
MAFDLAAWALIFVVVSIIGHGALALLGANDVRPGDRLILGAWIGTTGLVVALLAVSLVLPVTPVVAACTAAVLAALGAAASRHAAATTRSLVPSPHGLPRWALGVGVAAVAVGAAALASDPVTLYDSLVYHVGIIRWLREVGTVPGVALVHNRLGHVSAWFTLAAAFEGGPAVDRAANVPLGFAMVLVGVQTALAVARIAARRAMVADWFLALGSAALIWPVAWLGAASPSPDVVTNVLILVAAWSLLIVSPDPTSFRRRLVPFVVTLGACSMKLFAVPAVLATGFYAVLAAAGEGDASVYVRRAFVCLGLASVIVGPFIAANLVASGCPAYPSPVGCLDAPWAVGSSRAAEYVVYVRDVARWERRGETSVGASLGWIGPWVLAHPVITLLAVASGVLAVSQLRRVAMLRDGRHAPIGIYGIRAVVAFALLGTMFAAWQAPAPRFLYAFVTIVPALVLAFTIHSRTTAHTPRPLASGRGGVAFALTGVVVGLVYAVASQKLNVRSALASGARLAPVSRADLLLPAAPALPVRLFRWRVNDVDLFTPDPRPIADTLGYQSVIGSNTAFEKCSTSPLPCTPYLPDRNIRLRRPERGLAAGFVRAPEQSLSRRVANCVEEVRWTPVTGATSLGVAATGERPGQCGDSDAR